VDARAGLEVVARKNNRNNDDDDDDDDDDDVNNNNNNNKTFAHWNSHNIKYVAIVTMLNQTVIYSGKVNISKTFVFTIGHSCCYWCSHYSNRKENMTS